MIQQRYNDQRAVHPVQDPAVTGDQLAGILDAGLPLNRAFKQVAGLARRGQKGRQDNQQRLVFQRQETGNNDAKQRGADHAGGQAADRALQSLLRADLLIERRFADSSAHKISGGVSQPDHDQSISYQ